MGSVRVAIVGVGNCAASLVQGVEYYKNADASAKVPGLMHVQFGDYHIRDIEFVAAFDVDGKKVGLDLSEAIGASENNTIKICEVPPLGVPVQRGHTLDGLGKYYRETITESDEEPVDVVAGAARGQQVDVLICYLPVGLRGRPRSSTRQCAIEAKVAFVNALPVFIASAPRCGPRSSRDAGVPIVGDDIKSQVGATITHRVHGEACSRTAASSVDRTYQLNVGGNMDFKNMLERDRLESKKISKTQAVTEQLLDHDPRREERAHRPVGLRRSGSTTASGRTSASRAATFGDVPLNARVQARGLGLPELGRRHHRRAARGEDRQGPRHRRPDPLGVVVLHEEPAGAVLRRPGSHCCRGVHRRRDRALT